MSTLFKNSDVLLKELKKGNEKAISFLMEKYHHDLCVYANNLCGNYDEAKDIVQNVFLKLWEKRQKINEIKSFKSYLYKAVFNRFINEYRKNSKFLVFEKEYIDSLNELVNSSEVDLLHQKIELVKKEIENLPSKCKKVFLMSKQDGLTNIEIADYLNISAKTVENHITKAFKILRKNAGEKIKTILFLLFDLKKLDKN